ncbi:hypothetical protein ACK307_01165 [Aeromonas caviae]
MSGRKIAELFKMDKATVNRTIAEAAQNRESRKCATPEVSTPAVPMASTKTAPRPARTPAPLLMNSSTLCLQIDDPL